MNTRCLGDMLLRPASFQRTLQTCTSANPLWQRATPGSTILQRSLTTTTKLQFAQTQQRRDDRPKTPPKSSSANQFADLLSTPKTKPPTATKDTSVGATIDDLFNSAKGIRTPNKKQPSSADEINNAHARQTFGEGWSTPLGRQRLEFEGLDLPDVVNSTSNVPTIQQPEPKYPRLNPTFGRTIDLNVSKGRDIVRGLMMLNSMVSRNKVRSNMHSQKFHERPGLKRKRLKSERWRARFQVAFKATCARVTELKKKGW